MQFFKHYIGLFFAVIIVISLSGCRNHSMTSELVYIDSLISDNNIDEALMRLRGLDINSFDQESTAYYTILLTLAKYKNFEEISSDSAINEAVDYFRSHNQQPRLKYSLIAKGCAEDVLGKPDESIKCFHEAELITCTGGIQQDAYIKLRLADLYHTQYIGSDTLAVQKYHAAYQLYKKLHDAHYQTICLGEIGGIYSDIPSKSDSALYYINSAISLAEQTHDDYYLFANYYSKSLYYLNTINDFTKAKESALKAISYTNEIDHPRAHYCLSASYVHLNKIDSSIYYLKLAPEPKSTIDSISYLNVLSQIEEFYHHEDKSRAYFKRSNSLADSSLIKSLSHRLLEVEKKYDLQQEELKNVSLQSKLKGAWLTIAVTLLAALMLFHILWRYRNRLRAKENEYNNLKEDLTSSLLSMEQLKNNIHAHEEKLRSTEMRYKAHISQQESMMSDLSDEIESIKASLQLKENEKRQLNNQIEILQSKKAKYEDIISIINGQIQVVHELIQSSYELDSNKFVGKFKSLMTMTKDERVDSYWANLQSLTNDLYNNILLKAQELANNRLSTNEINLIALSCCGYTRTAIMICMRYKNVATISNMKYAIAKKMGIGLLDEFIHSFQEEYNQSNNTPIKS